MRIQSHKDLIVWQKSIELVERIYSITREFPKSETYGLASQMQRASVSIPSCIAEGHARNHIAEFVQFLGIAYASGAELETQLVISKKLYPTIDYKTAEFLLDQVSRMLKVLIYKLKQRK